MGGAMTRGPESQPIAHCVEPRGGFYARVWERLSTVTAEDLAVSATAAAQDFIDNQRPLLISLDFGLGDLPR